MEVSIPPTTHPENQMEVSIPPTTHPENQMEVSIPPTTHPENQMEVSITKKSAQIVYFRLLVGESGFEGREGD